MACIDSKPRSFYLFFAAIFLSEIILASEVSDIRTWRAPDHTRVVFDLTGPSKHTLLILIDNLMTNKINSPINSPKFFSNSP